MATTHIYNQFQYTQIADTVTLFLRINIGASGSVSSAGGLGFTSVTKESAAGQYSIKLDSKLNRFIGMRWAIVDDAISQIANIQVFEDPSAIQADMLADQTFKIQCLAVESDATPVLIAANPASGATLLIEVVMRMGSYTNGDSNFQ